ncbi:MAG: hypothetical protein ACU0CO_01535 [Shimia sp.]
MQAAAFLGLDVRLWQALIAGVFVALGWIVNGARTRREARRLRAEKLRDYHKAIFAEVRDMLSRYAEGSTGDAILARMRAEPGFVPFVPSEPEGRIFAVVVSEVEVLPRATIDAIVAYYAQVGSIAAFVEDMRGPVFAELDVERRCAIYADYQAMRRRAFTLGEFVLAVIAAYAESGDTGARRAAEDFTRRQ